MQITKTNYSQNMNIVHIYFDMNENFYRATEANLSYFYDVLAKSKISREKLDNQKANSTPTRAFFVRNFRTPKERQIKACSSMVGRNRQPLAGYFPFEVVSHPVTFYRPTVRSLAVVFEKLSKGLSAMLYLFKVVSRSDLRNTNKLFSSFPRYTVRINADSIEQATAQVAPFFVILEVRNER